MLDSLIGGLYNEIPTYARQRLAELRLRLGRPITFRTALNERGRLASVAGVELIDKIVATATQNSRYAYEIQMSEGYLGYAGGIRIGLCGTWVENCQKIAIKSIKSLLIRIPHQIVGCADGLPIFQNDYKNTLIVAPPSCGKTTLLRDAVRVLAGAYDVLVLDERFEICGGEDMPFDLGAHCDVIGGVPKRYAYRGAIRAMSPEIVAMDELFGLDDANAVEELAHCGVKILATLHGNNINDVKIRLNAVENVFENIVFLNSIPSAGHIDSIIRRG